MLTKTTTLLPATGFYRIWSIVGDPKRDIKPLIPVCKTAFMNGVKSGKYPKPVKLGDRTNAWRVEDIHKLIESLGEAL